MESKRSGSHWYVVQWLDKEDKGWRRWKDIQNFVYQQKDESKDQFEKAKIQAYYHCITHNVRTRILQCKLIYQQNERDEEETDDV
jgi:hypothetical protein